MEEQDIEPPQTPSPEPEIETLPPKELVEQGLEGLADTFGDEALDVSSPGEWLGCGSGAEELYGEDGGGSLSPQKRRNLKKKKKKIPPEPMISPVIFKEAERKERIRRRTVEEAQRRQRLEALALRQRTRKQMSQREEELETQQKVRQRKKEERRAMVAMERSVEEQAARAEAEWLLHLRLSAERRQWEAAVMVQRAVRRWKARVARRRRLQKERNAAITIQAITRGFLVRERRRKRRTQRIDNQFMMSNLMMPLTRGFGGLGVKMRFAGWAVAAQREKAIHLVASGDMPTPEITLQEERELEAKRKLDERRLQTAIKMQALWRGYCGRNRVDMLIRRRDILRDMLAEEEAYAKHLELIHKAFALAIEDAMKAEDAFACVPKDAARQVFCGLKEMIVYQKEKMHALYVAIGSPAAKEEYREMELLSWMGPSGLVEVGEALTMPVKKMQALVQWTKTREHALSVLSRLRARWQGLSEDMTQRALECGWHGLDTWAETHMWAPLDHLQSIALSARRLARGTPDTQRDKALLLAAADQLDAVVDQLAKEGTLDAIGDLRRCVAVQLLVPPNESESLLVHERRLLMDAPLEWRWIPAHPWWRRKSTWLHDAAELAQSKGGLHGMGASDDAVSAARAALAAEASTAEMRVGRAFLFNDIFVMCERIQDTEEGGEDELGHWKWRIRRVEQVVMCRVKPPKEEEHDRVFEIITPFGVLFLGASDSRARDEWVAVWRSVQTAEIQHQYAHSRHVTSSTWDVDNKSLHELVEQSGTPWSEGDEEDRKREKEQMRARQELWSAWDPHLGRELVWKEDGSIQSVTPVALVRLVTSGFDVPPTAFVSQVLLMFRSIVDRMQWMALLAERWDGRDSPRGLPLAEPAFRVRSRVLSLLGRWLCESPFSEDFLRHPSLRMHLDGFLSRIQDDELGELEHPLEELRAVLLFMERASTKEEPLSDDEQGESSSDSETGREEEEERCGAGAYTGIHLTQLDPDAIARELTLMEHAIYRRARPMLWVSRVWTKDVDIAADENVATLATRLNRVRAWVLSAIFGESRLPERVELVSQFIRVSVACRGLGNFNTMSEIAVALLDRSVRSLKATWSRVSSELLEELNHVTMLASSDAAFLACRRYASALAPPTLPYLGQHLMDLTFAEQNFADIEEEDDMEWVNWEKRVIVGNCIREVLLFQQVPFRFEADECLRNRLLQCPIMPEGARLSAAAFLREEEAHINMFSQQGSPLSETRRQRRASWSPSHPLSSSRPFTPRELLMSVRAQRGEQAAAAAMMVVSKKSKGQRRRRRSLNPW